ncbi:MAG: hydrogenase [Deltaproteobacteria bacterium CG11_big_fil_rev_8_21_14_0_20_49_13]|nr:MAG: hydrogenase [Deltaproteobacteria bacterium CG11_big_fil_rev_8_21_14_0_20_49_13]
MTRNFTTLRNATSCKEEGIPLLSIGDLRIWIIDTCKTHEGRVVSLFGNRTADGNVRLYGILGIDGKGEIRIASADVNGISYESLTPALPEAHLFERELHENLGIIPKGHPWLKPVRKQAGYNYYSVSGDSIHEVAVGPVHAGVIEPGHFRFQCHGEKVFNLEIHLGYQHRGVEEMIKNAGPSKRMILAESIAGDSVISHGLAYCHAVEGLAMREVTQRARIIRAMALEIERMANHVGDLGAIANDVGFLPAASYFGRIRAEFLNMLLTINGNRFGRSLLKPGGVRFDIPQEMAEGLKKKLKQGMKDVNDTVELMFGTASVIERLEGTGTVSHETAKELGLVGVAARACNLQRDVRRDYPFGHYRFGKFIIAKAASGDVFARSRVRYLEIKRSAELVAELLERMPNEKVDIQCEGLNASSLAVSMIEGWRGEVVHIARTNGKGEVIQYKIVDPSFHNWTGLEMALRSGQISDFPLCNKSFNLSYAGYDL